MYDSMHREFYWPHIAHKVYKVVRDCESCVKSRGARYRHGKLLQFLSAEGHFKSIAMEFFGPLPKTKSGNFQVLVIKDHLSKITRALELKHTTTGHVFQAFC